MRDLPLSRHDRSAGMNLSYFPCSVPILKVGQDDFFSRKAELGTGLNSPILTRLEAVAADFGVSSIWFVHLRRAIAGRSTACSGRGKASPGLGPTLSAGRVMKERRHSAGCVCK